MGMFDGWSDWMSGAGIAALINPATAVSTLAAGGTNIFNSWLNYKNYQSQQDNLEWQQWAQLNSFQREDNAVQRRVADLKAAGLSPVLAAGQGASSGPIVSTSAPQASPLPDFASSIMSLIRMASDVSKTNAETELVKLQQENSKSQTLMNMANLGKIGADIKKTNIDSYVQSLKARQEKISTENTELTGSSGDSQVGKMMNDAAGWVKGVVNDIKGKVNNEPKQRTNQPNGWFNKYYPK